MPTIKALSLWNPWAAFVREGLKGWETRSWATGYRGPIAIHATKNPPPMALALCVGEGPIRDALVRLGIVEVGGLRPRHIWLREERLHNGCVICIADLTDVKRITSTNAPPPPEYHYGDYTPGRFMFRLENVRPITPTPARGKQGLWNWDVPAGIAI